MFCVVVWLFVYVKLKGFGRKFFSAKKLPFDSFELLCTQSKLYVFRLQQKQLFIIQTYDSLTHKELYKMTYFPNFNYFQFVSY